MIGNAIVCKARRGEARQACHDEVCYVVMLDVLYKTTAPHDERFIREKIVVQNDG